MCEMFLCRLFHKQATLTALLAVDKSAQQDSSVMRRKTAAIMLNDRSCQCNPCRWTQPKLKNECIVQSSTYLCTLFKLSLQCFDTVSWVTAECPCNFVKCHYNQYICSSTSSREQPACLNLATAVPN